MDTGRVSRYARKYSNIKNTTYRNLLLECDDGGSEMIDFDLALSEASDDITIIEHSRVVVFVLLVLRS